MTNTIQYQNGEGLKSERRAVRRALKVTTSLLMAAAMAGSLSACNLFSRLSDVGGDPQLTQITNPMARTDYKPVNLPMPAPQPPEINPNSLWRAGAKAFFKDHRAKTIGDIVTVQLSLADKASLSNTTARDRDDSEDTNVTSLLGYENSISKIFPHTARPASLISFNNVHSTSGEGTIERSETISLTFAAVVTQILPNGNLVVIGRQELRVNKELRELLVSGVVNPGDIDPDNIIDHTKIAEMRVAYGGRGTLSDLQAPRWGTQIWDIVFPF